jgi:hypothetical protein
VSEPPERKGARRRRAQAASAYRTREHLPPGRGHRADRHDERVDDDVLAADPVVGRAFDDLPRDREPHVWVLADPGLVVRDRDDRGAVLGDEGQHGFQAFVLAGHRVDERPPPIDVEPRLERRDDRRVDRERHVGERLHQTHRLGEDRGLVRERDPRVHVQHVRAGLDLGEGIGDDGREITSGHLIGELLRPVGLIRSPMTTNGRSNPIATSFVAELRIVSVTPAPCLGIRRP